jgi:putative ABC transport system permease protein
MISDLRWTIRWLARRPAFTFAITAILALGIAANTAIYGIVDAVLLRPLPFASAERLVRVEATSPKNPTVGISAQDYFLWNGRIDLFEKTIPFLKDIATITGAGDPDQLTALRTSPDLFSLLGVRARLGRALIESDDHVAVLSNRLWQRRFSGDPGALGRTITISDEAFTIVGVMAPEFDFPASEIELWVPLRLSSAATTRVQVLGRLQRGKTPAQVQSAMENYARQMEQADPRNNSGIQLKVSPWRDTMQREYELTLMFVLAAVGLVLLIACADVASLLLSRAVQRRKEMAIRASLGAGLWRVVRQLIAESLVLAILGSVAGIAAARYVLQILTTRIAALPVVLPHMQRAALNGRVLLFNVGLCALIACLCAVAPTLLLRQTDLQTTLRGGTDSGRGNGAGRLFSMFIATEAAFAFLLLTGSGLMVRSLIRLEQADHGFHPDHVLTMRVPLGSLTQTRPPKYATRPLQMAYYHDLMSRLERIPGVGTIAIVNNLPLSGVNTTTAMKGPSGEQVLNSTRTISPQYFSAMGIPLLRGRTFTDADQAGAPPVAIINEFMAHQLFPDRDPLGQALPGESGATVVGVVKDSPQMSYEKLPKGEIYSPYTQFIFGAFMSTLVVRTPGDPLKVADTLRKAIWEFDPHEPITKVETMDAIVAESIWRPRFSAWLFSVLGGLARALTAAGVYGVVAYTTTLRTREVGIRVALGATPGRVVALILRDSMIPLTAGLLIGLAAAQFLSRLLGGVLYEIHGSDPITYVGVTVTLLAIGLTACVVPALKAAAGDPLRSLRVE